MRCPDARRALYGSRLGCFCGPTIETSGTVPCRELEEDVALLKGRLAALAGESGLGGPGGVPDDYVEEVTPC